MKILGILGGHRRDGVTGKMLETVLSGVDQPNQAELVYLEDYPFKPDHGDQKDPVLDQLEAKMLASDVWVIAAPTYWGGLAGEMKDFFDCMRQRLVRIDHLGATHPDRFKDKHYLSLTNCYTGTFENWVTGVTDQSFRTIDKVMSAAGVIKLHELVVTNTYGMTELPDRKKQACLTWGKRLNSIKKRDDSTVKRYIELFFMIAVMALVTMGIQLGFGFVPKHDFWMAYASFVVIFYVLLGSILHFFTVVKHRRR
ncbi:flavin reductase [Lentilactobacillus parafarraginis F0439]|uniref:Flavin reductase n=2 Tax=Lentilactobacillus parafarraginis TaxID=390842 RepID=A0A0R1YH67_9LACO|nr:flavodoxin family protein [Lentilactobacillus parafarraginis]EHL98019.1 flavin reductase [Lentilactobacillus parafarraginis F0439]KRM41634.1 flavin reductase [Lentilactobacillus parafarraginis DSM 18390 = JCM 14109]